MTNIQFQGPAGRLEGKYAKSENPDAPLAMILQPHPKYGGTMNNKVVYNLFKQFQLRDFTVLRFNFRGVGMSEGEYDGGPGELADAAAALDWLQNNNKQSNECWIAGFSFGSWIGMQLLMRRPELEGFISVAPPVNLFDFNFLTPCPGSGVIINGSEDKIVPASHVKKLAAKLKSQKRVSVEHVVIEGANHFFDSYMNELNEAVQEYLTSRKAGMSVNFLSDMGIE